MNDDVNLCPECGEPLFEWYADTHKLLQIIAAPEGLSCVYAMPDGTLELCKADLLALAAETTYERMGHRGQSSCRYYKSVAYCDRPDGPDNVVVALILEEECNYVVAKRSESYVGLCREGEDPEELVWLVDQVTNPEFFAARAARERAVPCADISQ